MPASVFFDTDVLIDFCTQSEPWFPSAARLLNLAAYRKIQGLTSASGLKDVFYFARKPEGEAKARRIIARLMKIVSVCEVNEAMCKGCGSCAGYCPSGAASIRHFTERQIFAEINGLLSY